MQFRVATTPATCRSGAPRPRCKLDRMAPSVPVPTGGASSWTNATPVTSMPGDRHRRTQRRSPPTPTSTASRPTTARPGRPPRRTDRRPIISGRERPGSRWQFRAVDDVGNWSAWSRIQAAATAKIDLVDPTDADRHRRLVIVDDAALGDDHRVGLDRHRRIGHRLLRVRDLSSLARRRLAAPADAGQPRCDLHPGPHPRSIPRGRPRRQRVRLGADQPDLGERGQHR